MWVKSHLLKALLLFITLFSVTSVSAASVDQAIIKTNFGDVVVELFPKQAPVSVKNFIAYAESGFYDGVIFHRVIPGFMVQTGGFDKTMLRKVTSKPIINEAGNGLRNSRGSLAMARTNNPDSATSQFFINLKDNNFLNRSGNAPQQAGYAVFGRVLSGMDVIDKIAQQPTGNKSRYSDVPLKDIVIEKVVLGSNK